MKNLKKEIMAILPTPNLELLEKAHSGDYKNGFPISWADAEKKINSEIADKIIKVINE